MRARRAAQEADLVVVNHHLLLADLAMKEEGFVEFLPGADVVILDEAHQIPDLATQFFGVSVGSLALSLAFTAARLPGPLLHLTVTNTSDHAFEVQLTLPRLNHQRKSPRITC